MNLDRFLKPFRTLRVRILFLFLSLSITSFCLIIGFSYRSNYQALHMHAHEIMGIASTSIIQNISSFFQVVERVTNSSAAFLGDIGEFSPQNKMLVSYLLNEIKYRSNIPLFYVGTPTGEVLEALNLSTTHQTHFRANPTQLLPSTAIYALEFIKKEGNKTTREITYYNEHLNPVAQESLSSATYDPRERPWYTGALKTDTLYWTPLYTYADFNEQGLTLSKKILDKKGNLLGVIGLDTTVSVLTNFILHQRIGISGKAFIFDSSGKILIPDTKALSEIPPDYFSALAQARKLFFETKESELTFTLDNKNYLAYVSAFPFSNEVNWLVGVIVPFKDFFGELIHTQQTQLTIVLIISIFSSVIIFYFAKGISAPITSLAKEIDKIRRLELGSNFHLRSNIHEINLIASSTAAMKKAVGSFTVYVPKEIVKHIISNQGEIALGGEKREITVFFSDIAGFTSLYEEHSADFILPLIAEYFDGLSKLILSAHGTIDKYIGDSIMAFWGAPVHQTDHAQRACTTALLCKQFIDQLNRKRKEENKPIFITRFGISTGTVIIGNIGTKERMNYTAIGDAVNTASRLQVLGKLYHTPILITEAVRLHLNNQFLLRPLGFTPIYGKNEDIKVYELIAHLHGDASIKATKKEIELCTLFTEAITAFEMGDRETALSLFEQAHADFPSDLPTQYFLERLRLGN